MKSYRVPHFKIYTADGSSQEVSDVFDVPIQFDGQFHVITVTLVPNLSQEIILGQDFLNTFEIKFKFKNGHDSYVDALSEISHTDKAIISREDLSLDESEQLSAVIQKMEKTIGVGLGRTSIISHCIDTGDHKPIYQKQYQFSPAIKKQIEVEVQEMLDQDVIEPSYSPWCSPILLVPKPTGAKRLCLDSRQLNKVTKRDTYPLPSVNNIVDNLKNAKFLSTLDLKSAFWQIPLDVNSKEKTAFAVPGKGLFHFKVMPFGLVNASQSQQRLMDMLFHSRDNKVWAYLDDIVICSATFREHLEQLEWVMGVLKEVNLTINVAKCKFARSSLKYLGFIVDKDGLRTDPDKVAAILNFPRPRNYTQLKRFIGLASWYRRFVKNFSTVAAPLHNLTKGNKRTKLVWNDQAEESFIALKTLLTTTPVMTCPDYEKPFIIQCDASGLGVGAVLCQEIDGVERPVAYLSRKLNDRERKFTTSERELLSVVHAIEKFRQYVDGTHFTVITDHSALQWLSKMRDPHGRLARWAMKLQQFDFDIVHRPGKSNVVADSLSRGINDSNININLIEILEKDKDEGYKDMVNKALQGENKDLVVTEGKLYKRVILKQYPNKDDSWKLVIPVSLRKTVIQDCHDTTTAGHFGVRKTLFRLKQQYYWPEMLSDVKAHVGSCEICAKVKSSNQPPAGLMGKHRNVTQPWQVISLDLMGPFPRSKLGNTMLLVITCWFSKFSLLFPLRTGKADKICDILQQQFLLYGVPQALICDNGKQFVSQHFKDICEKHNCKIWYTPNYHPQANPTERVNRVIGTSISAFIKNKKHNEWDVNIYDIGHAIRSSIHESTGYSPSYLFFGRETNFPNFDRSCLNGFDIEAGDRINVLKSNYLTNIEQRKILYREVSSNMQKSYKISSDYYDKFRSKVNFEIGDVVWKKTKYLSNKSDKFMAKLAPKFEKAIIVDKISSNVFFLNNAFGKSIGMWHVKDLKKFTN